MELSAPLLALLCLAAAGVAFWHASLAAREAANRAAITACEQLRLQFLDGTVAFARARPVRGPGGWLALRRTYVFDYTADSIARRRGFVIVTGDRVESVGFESETTPPRQPGTPPASPPPGPVARESGPQVLDLADWRRRRASRPSAGSADRDEDHHGRPG